MKIAPYKILLASKSPRRQALLKSLGLPFEVRLKSIKEDYPNTLSYFEISNFLAELKAEPYRTELKPKDILITSDTIVWHNNTALGKPKSKQEAKQLLLSLSHSVHEVISSVCFTTTSTQKTVYDITKVHFDTLEENEIDSYVETFNPLDKAGAYGIQDWIGLAKISKIEGSYFTVMGFPTHLVYQNIRTIISD